VRAVTSSAFAGELGVARRDITPPVGIYARLWGAATHEVAEGIHRPLTATALAVRDDSGPLVLVALDLPWWKRPADEWRVRGVLVEELDLDPARVVVALSHTHAGPSISTADAGKPGGGLVAPYLEHVRTAVAEAGREALASARPGTLAWGTGPCDLARHRDLPDGDRLVCGFNPDGPADDTLLVARAVADSGETVATVVNYACHPTTLAWENRLLSPDWVGAMREVVERATEAPCLFLQGASGELGPAEGLTGDAAVADRNGRRVGYAALAALEGLLPAGERLEYEGVVESGAPLAVWRRGPTEVSRRLEAQVHALELDRKEVVPLEELERRWAGTGERAAGERIERARLLREALGDDATVRYPFWVWRLGDAALVAQPGEPYSLLQTELRRRFPQTAVAVVSIANGHSPGYLVPAELAGADLYQAWQSPFAPGSLERLVEAAAAALGSAPTKRRSAL
jgi:hypothetical protein